MKTMNRKQKGFSLIELLFVAAGIGLMLVYVFPRAMAFFDGQETQNETVNVQQLAASIKKLYSNEANYSGLTNAVLLSTNAVPEHMRGTGSNISSEYDPAGYTVTAINSNTQYQISAASVPQGACVELVSQVLNAFESIKVGSTTVTSVASASTACSAATNTILFIGA